MKTLETLLPVMLLIGTGWVLARIRLLGAQFIGDMNKLCFYVALPAFIFRSMAEVRVPVGGAIQLFLLLFVCTLLAALLAVVLGVLLGARRESLGSVAQVSFRGNLAYAGIPIFMYSLIGVSETERLAALGTALLVFAPLTVSYNFLGVICLQKKSDEMRGVRLWLEMGRAVITNPLIISCLGGLGLALAGFRFPGPVDETLKALGAIAMPVALLCIGGSFVSVELGGRHRSIWIGVGVKLVVLPLLAWLGCWMFGVEGMERRIVLIFAGVPTAATAYTMAKQMGGDETVTSASIMLSTLLAAISLGVILALVE